MRLLDRINVDDLVQQNGKMRPERHEFQDQLGSAILAPFALRRATAKCGLGGQMAFGGCKAKIQHPGGKTGAE
jgi:hypothetical protein